MGAWDLNKKRDFVKVAGKKRQKFFRGGHVKRFANGGQTNTTLEGPDAAGTVNNTAANPNSGLMGTIGGALGINNNFKAGSAKIQAGTNAAQLNNSYTDTQGALTNQGNIVQSLQPQVNPAVANQNAVAQQLYGMTMGQGPNPAQAQLAQNTQANIAAQAALMAGQRGAGANVGQMARQIAQQGAMTQQQSVGQAATLQAQQQIQAQQNLSNLANQQINQSATAVTNQNNAQQGEQQILQNANTAYNNAGVGMQSNINNVNSATAIANQQSNQGLFGGIMSGLSGLGGGGGGFFAEGGEVGDDKPSGFFDGFSRSYNHEGDDKDENPLKTGMSQFVSGIGEAVGPIFQSPNHGAKAETPGITPPGPSLGYAPVPVFKKGGNVCAGPHRSHVANYLFAEGGKVPALVSPGEIYLNPEQVHKVIHEDANPLKIGQKIGGKAKVKGDSYKNDTVPTELDEGGVVLPRHITQSKKMSPEKAALFVHKAVAKKKAGKQ